MSDVANIILNTNSGNLIPQNIQSSDYTLVLSDSGKHIFSFSI